MASATFDLEHRLLHFAAAIVRLEERLPKTRAGNHVAGQVLRSGTSPLSNHAEGQAAESRSDFVHKLSVCLKELRETKWWLLLIRIVPLVDDGESVRQLVAENEELIRIFKASVTTAKARLGGERVEGENKEGVRTSNVQRRTSNVEVD